MVNLFQFFLSVKCYLTDFNTELFISSSELPEYQNICLVIIVLVCDGKRLLNTLSVVVLGGAEFSLWSTLIPIFLLWQENM